jgi:hypothetical protein
LNAGNVDIFFSPGNTNGAAGVSTSWEAPTREHWYDREATVTIRITRKGMIVDNSMKNRYNTTISADLSAQHPMRIKKQ